MTTPTLWSTRASSTNSLLRHLIAWNSAHTLNGLGYSPLSSDGGFGAILGSASRRVGADTGDSSRSPFDLFLLPMPQAGSSKIVFMSNRDGNAEIYSMNFDGSLLSQLTNNPSNDDNPRWSPNGTKIIFQSDRDNPETGNHDIYVMNADGSGQTRLTNDAADDSAAAWSADGSKIVFQSLRNGLYYQVYVMNADGTNQVNVTNGASADTQPSWSPDGTKIAFGSERDHAGTPSVYVMNASGSNQTRLTFSSIPFRDEQPAWSLNGTRIAFVSMRDSVLETWQETDDDGGVVWRSILRTNKEIYAMNADGTNQVRLTNNLELDDSPSWSADNTKIVFHSDREFDCCDPTPHLWTMNADGTNQLALTTSPYGDYSPSWSSGSNQGTGAYGGTPAAIPGTVEGENYDNGGAEVAYHDTSPNSHGQDYDQPPNYPPPSYRQPTDVDIYKSAGGYNNGHLVLMQAGDWMNYAVNVAQSGTYTLQARVAWGYGAGGTFHVEMDGVNKTGPIQIPDTGWSLQLITKAGVQLAGGEHLMRVVADTNAANGCMGDIDYLTFTASSSGVTSSEQYIANFYQQALLRQPYPNESDYWNDTFRAAYQNGQASLVLATREFGKTVFESAEYAARNRSDHDYVYDLYKTYLLKEPDQPDWDNWTAVVPQYGREYVRRGFDESGEFLNLLVNLPPSSTPSSAVTSLSAARVDPFNQPGNGLASRDAQWSLPLLSLPGRAGLDLGLSLSYSSMVWTRSGPYIYFDEDNGSPSPGFRLGFPTIGEKVFDAQVGRNVYVLATSSGSRVELRPVGTSNVYEASDSSYLQLIDNGTLLVRTTDGTQLSYGWYNHEFRCNQVKDRNGNFITVNYDWLGHMTAITDTLARTLTFNYDTNANLISITQSWTVDGVAQTHVWASFGWGTTPMQPNFSGVAVVGAANGSTIPVLTQVGLDDGSRYNFEYNGAGQVWVISSYRSDNVQRSNTAYDYETAASDCPRLSATRVSARDWTNINGVPAEVVTQYGDPQDGSHVLTMPDGTVYKEYYGPGWQRGLVTQSEVWSGGVRQKWTATNRTQDNPSVSYLTNPRITETNVYDSVGNRRRTAIDYSPPQYAQFGLPYFVSEYAADGVTEIRRSYNDYNLAQAYLDRRIIGLVSAQHVLDPVAGAWRAKVTYGYDDPARIQSQATTAPGHDQSYDGSFTVRGNQTAVARWDVNEISNAAKALVSNMNYDAAGSVLSSTDAAGHTGSIGYGDSFSDGVNRNTLAYPTTITDADGFSTYLQYNFDFGSKTRIQGPPPANQPQGLIQTFTYDAAARLDRVTTSNTGAYTQYLYGPYYTYSFASINNVATNFFASDSSTIQVFDGAGRIYGTSSYHPGSAGGYKAQLTYYDVMGRANKQSNPTETTVGWVPAGDDAAGWFYTKQTYDWKGRPRVTTNPNKTTKEASYGGCGCAGGEVVTLTDEGTIDGGVVKRRQQRIYSDVLGRTVKTEVFSWQGGGVYSATVNSYNARDQLTLVRQYAGPEGSAAYQDTTMAYDGYGRLQTRHVPQQAANTATTYSYHADDTVQSVTDARGAAQNFGYNGRHLVTSTSYYAPYGVTPTSPVSYAYDAAGNRTSMTDGPGSKIYQYDQLSRLTSEARTINGVGTYTLNYGYNLVGELTSITDPFGVQVGYSYDGIGRVTSVTGANFANLATYASNIQYRAWGALKHLDYGNSKTLDATYNARLQPASFTVPSVMSKTYDYQADGRLKFSHDLNTPNFDRSYAYDHAGRITQALSGAEARNEGTTNARPYRESFSYDELGHLVERPENNVWSGGGGSFSPWHQTYQNERNTVWQYDADGNLTDSGNVQYTVDAAGQVYRTVSLTMIPYHGNPYSTIWGISADQTQSVDGDGQVIKKVVAETTKDNVNGDETTTNTSYLIRSSVLDGKVLTEISSETGQRGFVYLGNEVLAWQLKTGTTESVKWEHRDLQNASFRMTFSYGGVDTIDKAELDPLGNNARTSDPNTVPSLKKLSLYPGFGASEMSGDTQCNLDGTMQPCYRVMRAVAAGAATIDRMNIPSDAGGSIPHSSPLWIPDGSRDKWNEKTATYIIGDGGHYEWIPDGFINNSLQQRQTQHPGALAPNGLAADHKLSDEECNEKLAAMFGGPGAKVSTGIEPTTLLTETGNANWNAGRRQISDDEGAWNGRIHIYTNAAGSPDPNVGLFTPDGFIGSGVAGTQVDRGGEKINYYRFSYSTGLVISYVHVGVTDSSLRPRGLNRSIHNDMRSVRIGTIAGPGGSNGKDWYNHTHINFYSKFTGNKKTNVMVDPRSVFCGF